MENDEIPGSSLWEAIANRHPEFSGNPEGAAHVAYRFEGQYLPALSKARTQEESERVWLAFWSYLTAPLTRRKPFGLSSRAADRLIAEYQEALTEGLG